MQRRRDRFALAGRRVRGRGRAAGRGAGGAVVMVRGGAERARRTRRSWTFSWPCRKFSSVFFSSSGVEVTYEPPPNVRVDVARQEVDLAQRLGLREGDQLREFDQLVVGVVERRADRVADGLRDRVDAPDVRGDLLAQVAQEVLLARDAHEVRVEVAEAHVGERVVVAELLVARLEVDGGEVFAERAAADVAVVHVHVGAAERVDDFDEALEVDVDDPVELQSGEHFALDRFRGEHAAAVDAFEPAAERVGGVDLFVRVVARLPACGC